jgi:hypothetical protein
MALAAVKVSVEPLVLAEVVAAQQADSSINFLIQRVQAGNRPSLYDLVNRSSDCKHLSSLWERLSVGEDGVLRRNRLDVQEEVVSQQIVVPRTLVQRVVRCIHDLGHFGVARTIRAIQDSYYWPRLRVDVRDFIANCPVCLPRKGPKVMGSKVFPPVQFGAPLDCIVMDATVISPTSPNGYKFVLSAVDSFTRYAWAVPLRRVTARAVVDFLVSIFVEFGCPRVLKTDEDTVNRAHLVKFLCRAFQVQRPGKIVYDPQSRAQVEVFHFGLQTFLAKATGASGERCWERLVPLYLMAYRAAPHSATQVSPYEALFGRPMLTPVDLIATEQLPRVRGANPSEFLSSLRRHTDLLQDSIRAKILPPLHTESPLSYPVTPVPIYGPGQLVWYKKPIKVRDKQKLDCPWKPAVIVKRLGQSYVTYIIELANGKRVFAHTKWLGPRRERLEQDPPAGTVQVVPTRGRGRPPKCPARDQQVASEPSCP